MSFVEKNLYKYKYRRKKSYRIPYKAVVNSINGPLSFNLIPAIDEIVKYDWTITSNLINPLGQHWYGPTDWYGETFVFSQKSDCDLIKLIFL